MRAKKILILIVLLTFTLPPVVVVSLLYINYTLSTEDMVMLLTSWELPVMTGALVIFFPTLILSLIRRVELAIEQRAYDLVKQRFQISVVTYIVSTMLFGLVAIPIGRSVGFTQDQQELSAVTALIYIFIANAPLLLRFGLSMEYLVKDVPEEYVPKVRLKFKYWVVTLVSSLGGLSLMIVSVYALLWRNEFFDDVSMSMDDIALRLLGVGLVVALLQILPVYHLGSIVLLMTGKISEFADRMGNKDLSEDLRIVTRDEFGDTAKQLNALRNNFAAVIGQMGENIDYLNRSSNELRTMSGSLSSSSSEQAASSEEMAASIEEMSANINISSENAASSARITKESEQIMLEGQTLMNRTLDNITAISEKVSMIENIAGQTNLLAINAFIEAAAAGEQGKGFAVVAREVRTLADMSKTAANEITELAKQSLDSSQDSKEIIDRVAEHLKKNSDMATGIATSASEQQTSSDQINSMVQNFNGSSQSMAASSEELAATANELSDRADTLDKIVKQFKV